MNWIEELKLRLLGSKVVVDKRRFTIEYIFADLILA